MTDLEISKALALAIGWEPNRIASVGFGDVAYINVKRNNDWANQWQAFDYRDWNVIGPIMERENIFVVAPFRSATSWKAYKMEVDTDLPCYLEDADTPQKAIALAVIGAKT